MTHFEFNLGALGLSLFLARYETPVYRFQYRIELHIPSYNISVSTQPGFYRDPQSNHMHVFPLKGTHYTDLISNHTPQTPQQAVSLHPQS
jgi:hypothetical protein